MFYASMFKQILLVAYNLTLSFVTTVPLLLLVYSFGYVLSTNDLQE
jgi:hypothetical protein